MASDPLAALRERDPTLAQLVENARIARSAIDGLPDVSLGPSWWRSIKQAWRGLQEGEELSPLGDQPPDETRFILAVADLARQLASFTAETRQSNIAPNVPAAMATAVAEIDEHIGALPGDAEEMLTEHQVKLARSRFAEIRRILEEVEAMLLASGIA